MMYYNVFNNVLPHDDIYLYVISFSMLLMMMMTMMMMMVMMMMMMLTDIDDVNECR